MADHPTCMIKKVDDSIRIPREWLLAIAKEDKDEYLFISDSGNILRVRKRAIYKYGYSASEGDTVPNHCLDFEYNPDDLTFQEIEGKLTIVKI